jgi:hypothetical protein
MTFCQNEMGTTTYLELFIEVSISPLTSSLLLHLLAFEFLLPLLPLQRCQNDVLSEWIGTTTHLEVLLEFSSPLFLLKFKLL